MYEGYLESTYTFVIFLKRVYKTRIKYIFSERTILCQFVDIFLNNLYANYNYTDRLLQCHVRATDFLKRKIVSFFKNEFDVFI